MRSVEALGFFYGIILVDFSLFLIALIVADGWLIFAYFVDAYFVLFGVGARFGGEHRWVGEKWVKEWVKIKSKIERKMERKLQLELSAVG